MNLLRRNHNLPEYCRYAVETFGDAAYETQDYSDGSLLTVRACEEKWY